MPPRKKAPKLAETFKCAKCDFVYRSPIPLVSVSHKCYAKNPAGERRFARATQKVIAQ